MIPTWTGRVVTGGLLVLDRPKDYNRYVRSFAGQYVELVIRKRKQQRSSQSNRRYWGYILEVIADASGMTKQEVHDALKYKFLREDGDGPLVKVKSTATLSTEEFSVYVERCQALGAEFYGIEWRD